MVKKQFVLVYFKISLTSNAQNIIFLEIIKFLHYMSLKLYKLHYVKFF